MAAPSKRIAKVTVISDVICPWCWIGKRSIETAAAQLPDVQLELEWKPYMLDPALPHDGVDKLQHYQKKFGARAKSMLQDPDNALNQRGRPIGIEFNYFEGSKVFNTLDPHKVMAFAHQKGGIALQNQLQEVLFRKYFKEGRNLGDRVELLDAAREAGLAESDVTAILDAGASHPLHSQVVREVQSAQSRISGVPHFIFSNGEEISGGESVGRFASAVNRAAK
jgi:predicted DsbA family dithiol-disulfide isomerase